MNNLQRCLITACASITLQVAPLAASADLLDAAHASYAYDSLEQNVHSALSAHCVRTGTWTADATSEVCNPRPRSAPAPRAQAPGSGRQVAGATSATASRPPSDPSSERQTAAAKAGERVSVAEHDSSERARAQTQGDASGSAGGGVAGGAIRDRKLTAASGTRTDASALRDTAKNVDGAPAAATSPVAASSSAAPPEASGAVARGSANPYGREQQSTPQPSSEAGTGNDDAKTRAADRGDHGERHEAMSDGSSGSHDGNLAGSRPVASADTRDGSAATGGDAAAEADSGGDALSTRASADAGRTDGGPVILPMTISLEASPFFDFDHSSLRPDSQDTLDRLLIRLKDVHYGKVIAVGYADPIGTELYNLELSRSRAESVRRYLESKGIPAASIESEGRGATQEYAAMRNCAGLGHAPMIECLRADRRVEVTILPADR
jgi:outer membrane protein OmpA-like peptidoglycan-associated protein